MMITINIIHVIISFLAFVSGVCFVSQFFYILNIFYYIYGALYNMHCIHERLIFLT